MEINPVLQPLVEKFVEVNNYDKMKTMLDIGFLGVDIIEKYYTINNTTEINNNLKKRFSKFEEEIKYLTETLQNVSSTKEREILDLKQKMEKERVLLEELLTKKIAENHKLNENSQQRMHDLRVELNKTYNDKLDEKSIRIEQIKKEYNDKLEEKTTEIEEKIKYLTETKEREKLDLNKKLEETHKLNENLRQRMYESHDELNKTYNDKLKEQAITSKQIENELFELKKNSYDNLQKKSDEHKNDITEIIKCNNVTIERLIESHEQRKNENENSLNEKIEKLEKENIHYKEKYEKLELNSVLKGKPYEDAIEEELTEHFEKNSNIYSIKRRSDKKGKGDFVVTHHDTGFRAMVEVKHMPKVSSTIKDQQPKFYNDLRDKTNNYDAGIMISSGKVEGKRSCKIEHLDDGKIATFIQGYNLGYPEIINMVLETVHNIIKNKNNKDFSKEELLEKFSQQYKGQLESAKKSKSLHDTQVEALQKTKDMILGIFNIDIDEHISDKIIKSSNLTGEIKREVAEYIEYKISEEPDIKRAELKKIVFEKCKEYIEIFKTDKSNGISKTMIDNIIKKKLDK